MITRRAFQAQALALAGAATLPRLALADGVKYTDDGLIYQPWFLESFLIMSEDLAEAQANGKRFCVFWELKGCPYCKETHRTSLSDPEIVAYLKDKFTILQLNIIGSRIVTDFDGEELSERRLAQKWGIKFTPTIQFFSDDPEAAKGRNGRENEVARMPGFFKPAHFLSMFQYVEEKAYQTQKFHEYVRAKS